MSTTLLVFWLLLMPLVLAARRLATSAVHPDSERPDEGEVTGRGGEPAGRFRGT